MHMRFTLLLTVLLVSLVFVIAAVWEFGSQHLFIAYRETTHTHVAADHWDAVRTAVIAVLIALLLTGPGLLWLNGQRVRRRGKVAWAADVAQSERYLRQATELAGLGFCIWDSVEDKCAYCSEQHARIHGTTVKDYMARASAIDDTLSFTHPEDREAFRAAIRTVRQGKICKIEYRLITPDGGVRHVREILKPIYDEDGRVVQEYATLQDITEQKAQQRSLKVHAERFREIFDEAPVSLWVEDWSDVKKVLDDLVAEHQGDVSAYLASHPEDLVRAYDLIKTIDISQETVRIYRAPNKEAMRGFEKSAYANPEEISGYRDAICGFLSGTYQHEYEAEETAFDKTRIIVRVRYVIPPKHRDTWSRVLVTVDDITERTKARTAVQESRAILRSLIDTMPAAISVRDRDGKFVIVNKMLADCYHLTTDEAERFWSSGEWSTENDPDRGRKEDIENEVRRVFATGKAIPFRERHYKTDAGAESWSVARLPIRDAAGQIKQVASIAFDITERKSVEEALVASGRALRDRVADLEEAQCKLKDKEIKLVNLAQDLKTARDDAETANRAKSQFLAAMSHELRTPLNAILGFSEIIKQETFGPVGSGKYLEYVEDIHTSGNHLLALINDLLDLSKIESGENELYEEPIDIDMLVQSTIRLIRHRAESGQIELVSDLQPGLPELWADRRKATQILVNLLSNAVKFTDPAGRVTLKIRCQEDSGFVFQVVDTGIGMTPADIPRALAHFTQVDSDLNRKFEGTGLGLPLTKALVELHGGSLDLQSEVGVGTVATVRFPKDRIADLERCASGA